MKYPNFFVPGLSFGNPGIKWLITMGHPERVGALANPFRV